MDLSKGPLNIHSVENYEEKMYQCLAVKCGQELPKDLKQGKFTDILLYIAELNGKTVLDDTNTPMYSKTFKNLVNSVLHQEILNRNFALDLNELRI